MWFQIDLNFAADVFYLNNALHSFLRNALTALCIHPCSSPWEIRPPFYLSCSPCTEEGLKQSKVQNRHVQFQPYSQPGPGAVLPELPPSHPQPCVCGDAYTLPLWKEKSQFFFQGFLCSVEGQQQEESASPHPALPVSPECSSAVQIRSSRSGSQFCRGKPHLWYQSGGVSPWGRPCNSRIPSPQFYPRRGWEDPAREFWATHHAFHLWSQPCVP